MVPWKRQSGLLCHHMGARGRFGRAPRTPRRLELEALSWPDGARSPAELEDFRPSSLRMSVRNVRHPVGVARESRTPNRVRSAGAVEHPLLPSWMVATLSNALVRLMLLNTSISLLEITTHLVPARTFRISQNGLRGWLNRRQPSVQRDRCNPGTMHAGRGMHRACCGNLGTPLFDACGRWRVLSGRHFRILQRSVNRPLTTTGANS
jgi:hypothetical protein